MFDNLNYMVSYMKFKKLTIGIPREIMEQENRVAAIPETVSLMVKEGASVIVEKNAGRGSYFNDDDYIARGASIEEDIQTLFDESDIILKVKEPKFNTTVNMHEIDMMKEGQVLITFLHPANPVNHEMIQKLAAKGVTSFSLDCIPRITRAQTMDALTSMSTVAGYKGILSAAYRLPKFMPMISTAVGIIRPATVFVLGAGIVGLQSLATAKRLGAVIYAADIRPDAEEQATSLGAKIIPTGVSPEKALGDGGYARHLPEDLLKEERQALHGIIKEADIVVLSALIPRKMAPVLITEEMVKMMKPGSTIVDISVDQGGNCELTEAGRVCVKHDVYIDGTQNIPGSVPSTASLLFAQNIYHLLELLADRGKINVDLDDEIIASSLVTREGKLVNRDVLDELELYRQEVEQ